MRPTLTVSVLVLAMVLAGCGQQDPGTNDASARSAISDRDTVNEQAEADLPPARSGPALEDEAGYDLNRGLVVSDEARSDFENFLQSAEGMAVERNIGVVDGEMRADRLTMDYNTFFGIYRSDVPVEAGTRFVGRVMLWSEQGSANFVLQISDFCSQNGADVESLRVEIGSEPTTYRIAHTFERTHACALLRVTNVTEGGAEVFAADAALVDG